jgi:hypothetical protein
MRSTFFVCALVILVMPPTIFAADKMSVHVLSSRPDMITGGDALVEIAGPASILSSSNLSVLVKGRDLRRNFRAGLTANTLVGRIEGLDSGKNLLEVRVGGKRQALIKLTNYPLSGPIFSGPHQTPFICQTELSGLGTPLDADCSAKTSVSYVYKSTQPVSAGAGNDLAGLPAGFKAYDPLRPRPSDVAQTTTTEGRKVDFIVRRERGTINRAVYEIAFLDIPGEALPDPWTKTPGWNGRLVYTFGGGCAAGYRQGEIGNLALTESFTGDLALSGGYAVATSSLNVLHNNCNDVLSAETVMMVKEYFIKHFGLPVHTIGYGGSGGSIQQHLIAQNYPGLLDGIIPMASFPDVISLTSDIVDCALLAHAFASARTPWTDEQKTAVSGFATWKTCAEAWNPTFSPAIIMAQNCDPVITKAQVYDAATNPKGVRCSIYDNIVNLLGRDEQTGFARRTLDNVGVQYGLMPFSSGKISADQFLELNEKIGGYDADGKIVGSRTRANPQALRIAYQTGRVNTGGGSLASIPIVDLREYLDTTGDIHDSFRSFATRARLTAANHSASNQVIFRMPENPGSGFGVGVNSIRLMDAWLDSISNDHSAAPAAAKVARNKPADVKDACWTAAGEKIVEPASYSTTGRCNMLYPPHADPRIAAGGPLFDDILKCRLKPIMRDDYKQSFSPVDLDRLKKLFPDGVCDYSRPGVEQQPISATWKRY